MKREIRPNWPNGADCKDCKCAQKSDDFVERRHKDGNDQDEDRGRNFDDLTYVYLTPRPDVRQWLDNR